MSRVVRDEPRERQREGRILEPAVQTVGRRPVGARRLPRAPREGRAPPNLRVVVEQQPVERLDGIARLAVSGSASSSRSHCSGRNRPSPPRNNQSKSARPDVGTPHSTSSVTRSGWRSAYASASVAPPRAAEHEPPVDAEVLAEPLDVGEQVRRGVGRQVGVRLARVRRAAPAPPLVEQDHAVRAPDRTAAASASTGPSPARRAAPRPASRPGSRTPPSRWTGRRRPRASRARTARSPGTARSWFAH